MIFNFFKLLFKIILRRGIFKKAYSHTWWCLWLRICVWVVGWNSYNDINYKAAIKIHKNNGWRRDNIEFYIHFVAVVASNFIFVFVVDVAAANVAIISIAAVVIITYVDILCCCCRCCYCCCFCYHYYVQTFGKCNSNNN